MKADVVIIGAGSAGLFAAREIALYSKLNVIVVEQGPNVDERQCPLLGTHKTCMRCSPCNITQGVGGAGVLSSGTLNLRPDIGGDLLEFVKDEGAAYALLNYVDQALLQYGAPKELYKASASEVEDLERKAAAAGIKFVPIPQRVIGSDNAPDVVRNFCDDLTQRGVRLLTGTRVVRIDAGGVKLEDGTSISSRYILAAPGRSGADWLAKEAKRLKIPTRYDPVDVGVRVEVPAVVMEPVTKICRDPKFYIHTETYDDFVRTFCVNHQGFVVEEAYRESVCVNGHLLASRKSPNTNFALLVRIKLTRPLEDAALYGKTIAIQATTLGGGKPILQRLGDLLRGRRSTWDRIERGNVKPTLRAVTPGDIAMAMPHRIVTDIIEGLRKLDKVIPGVASDSTLLYAPEIKFPASRILVNENFETSIENLFVAGDGAGLSRGIVTAAATGVLAARGILRKEGIELPDWT